MKVTSNRPGSRTNPIKVQVSKVRASYKGQRSIRILKLIYSLVCLGGAGLYAGMACWGLKTTTKSVQTDREMNIKLTQTNRGLDCELSARKRNNAKLDTMVDFQGRFAALRGTLNRSGLSYPQKLQRVKAFKSANSPEVQISLEALERELAADLTACREKK